MSSRITKRTALRVAGGALLLALLIPFLVFAVPDVTGVDESYVVTSGSMSPTIEAGDAIFVEETSPEEIEEGDVLTFHADDPEAYHGGNADTDLVTHRVTDVDGSGDGIEFTTQGDANDHPDAEPVSGEQVVGVVAFSIPYIGWVISFAGTQLGILLLVVVPCVLLVLNEAYELLYSGSGETR